jgi:hypothetical protein
MKKRRGGSGRKVKVAMGLQVVLVIAGVMGRGYTGPWQQSWQQRPYGKNSRV